MVTRSALYLLSKFTDSKPMFLVVANKGFLISGTRKEEQLSPSIEHANISHLTNLDQETVHWINHQALIFPAVEEDYLQAPHSQSIANDLKHKRIKTNDRLLMSNPYSSIIE